MQWFSQLVHLRAVEVRRHPSRQKQKLQKEETSSDKEVTQEPVSEEEAVADGFTDGSDGESAKLDTSEELTGIHHAGIDIKDYGSIEIELDADTAPITVTNFVSWLRTVFMTV